MNNQEWIHSNKVPSIDGAEFQVWLQNGDVRTVKRNPMRDWSSLWFQDNWNPKANAYCAPEAIKAWRLFS